ncbi:hypothetical protein MMC13_003958 [Lambiella insularis]|nr:hypothetical protein [Lambiella insularis]
MEQSRGAPDSEREWWHSGLDSAADSEGRIDRYGRIVNRDLEWIASRRAYRLTVGGRSYMNMNRPQVHDGGQRLRAETRDEDVVATESSSHLESEHRQTSAPRHETVSSHRSRAIFEDTALTDRSRLDDREQQERLETVDEGVATAESSSHLEPEHRGTFAPRHETVPAHRLSTIFEDTASTNRTQSLPRGHQLQSGVEDVAGIESLQLISGHRLPSASSQTVSAHRLSTIFEDTASADRAQSLGKGQQLPLDTGIEDVICIPSLQLGLRHRRTSPFSHETVSARRVKTVFEDTASADRTQSLPRGNQLQSGVEDVAGIESLQLISGHRLPSAPSQTVSARRVNTIFEDTASADRAQSHYRGQQLQFGVENVDGADSLYFGLEHRQASPASDETVLADLFSTIYEDIASIGGPHLYDSGQQLQVETEGEGVARPDSPLLGSPHIPISPSSHNAVSAHRMSSISGNTASTDGLLLDPEYTLVSQPRSSKLRHRELRTAREQITAVEGPFSDYEPNSSPASHSTSQDTRLTTIYEDTAAPEGLFSGSEDVLVSQLQYDRLRDRGLRTAEEDIGVEEEIAEGEQNAAVERPSSDSEHTSTSPSSHITAQDSRLSTIHEDTDSTEGPPSNPSDDLPFRPHNDTSRVQGLGISGEEAAWTEEPISYLSSESTSDQDERMGNIEEAIDFMLQDPLLSHQPGVQGPNGSPVAEEVAEHAFRRSGYSTEIVDPEHLPRHLNILRESVDQEDVAAVPDAGEISGGADQESNVPDMSRFHYEYLDPEDWWRSQRTMRYAGRNASERPERPTTPSHPHRSSSLPVYTPERELAHQSLRNDNVESWLFAKATPGPMEDDNNTVGGRDTFGSDDGGDSRLFANGDEEGEEEDDTVDSGPRTSQDSQTSALLTPRPLQIRKQSKTAVDSSSVTIGNSPSRRPAHPEPLLVSQHMKDTSLDRTLHSRSVSGGSHHSGGSHPATSLHSESRTTLTERLEEFELAGLKFARPPALKDTDIHPALRDPSPSVSPVNVQQYGIRRKPVPSTSTGAADKTPRSSPLGLKRPVLDEFGSTVPMGRRMQETVDEKDAGVVEAKKEPKGLGKVLRAKQSIAALFAKKEG